MKESTLKTFRTLAAEKAGPISQICESATEQGVVLNSKLEKGLADAGYEIEYKDADHGAWCYVYLEEKDEAGNPLRSMKAQGYSADRGDALLHAAFGAVREEQAAKSVQAKLEEHQIEVTADLRARLESVHILHGPETAADHIATISQIKAK